jgi:hypothetical protein
VAYTHFGARLARPGRFDSCTLYQVSAPVVQRTRTVGLHPTDAGSTPERRTKMEDPARIGLARDEVKGCDSSTAQSTRLITAR